MFKRDRSIIIIIALLLIRIPLSRIIGDNGMGYLSGPMEMFMLLTLLFGSGLTGTMKNMMLERVKREQYRNAGVVFSLAKRYAFIAAFAMLFTNLALYESISNKLLLDGGQRLAYLLVGPAVLISIFISLNRGYLSGTGNESVLVLGELIETVAVAFFVIFGAIIGVKKGKTIAALLRFDDVSAMYGALGAMIGLCIGLFIGFMVYFVMVLIYQKTFKHYIKGDTVRRTEYSSDIFRKLFSGIIEDGVLHFLVQLPILLLIILFRKNGIINETDNINSMVGVFYCKYLSVIGLCSALSIFHVGGAIRGIVVAFDEDEDQNAAERLSRIFGRVTFFAIPTTIFVVMLSQVIVNTLFTGMVTTIISVLSIGGAAILLYSLMYLFMTVLVKLDYHKESIMLAAIALIVSGVFSFIFVYKQGKGLSYMAVSLMIFYFVNMLLCLFVLLRSLKVRLLLINQLVIPLIVAGVTGIIVKLITGALFGVVGGIISLIIAIILMWFIYNFACVFLRTVSAGAMSRKFLGLIFVRIGQNMGIY